MILIKDEGALRFTMADDDEGNGQMPDNPNSGQDDQGPFPLWMTLLTVLVVLFLVTQDNTRVADISWTDFEHYVESGEIDYVTIGRSEITGAFRTTQPDLNDADRFRTVLIDAALAERLSRSDVDIRGARESTLLASLFGWLFPLIIVMGLWLWISRRMMPGDGLGNYSTMRRSGATTYVETETGVDFNDVAGVDEAKVELMEVVDFLQNPEEYRRLGAHIPKGVLLVGPPGTGKTLLARAVAGQAGVPFFSITGSEFVEMFVGVGAARVRDLFDQARAAAPAIIFIDELDALGRSRGTSQLSNNEEREQTLHQLLAELDGFDPTSGIVLLAATNRPEILDPALLRAGRFDRQVLVDRPDKAGRIAILNVHIRKIQISPQTDLERIASLTTGFSGADLANLVNEAAILATRRQADMVEFQDFEAAIERVVAGLERRKRVLSDKERRTIAHHELGHALTALALPDSDPIQKISIIPRGISALGYTMQRPTEDRYLATKDELKNKICILLGGRAGEEVALGEISTGAADDLMKATEIARSIVERFGMDDELGHVTFEGPTPLFLGEAGRTRKPVSEAVASKIDEAVSSLISEAYDQAVSILKRNKSVLTEAALVLLDVETLGAEEIEDLRKKMRPPHKLKVSR
ncbi:MAG: ATP-dependent zinc metalloprotease FtsH [Henriciella sp.]|nr:ATP-dependent zinc metalloprotease FtsH [Henriciella sp.]